MSVTPHIPILVNEILEFFDDVKIRYFLDGTLGAGGHAEAFLLAHKEIKDYWGFDQDPEALEIAKKRLQKWKKKLHFIHGNYRYFNRFLESELDGMLLDLGISSMQLDIPQKGFSFSKEGPLDMRMDPENTLTAAEIINRYPQKELERIIREYGEEPRWRQVAKAIVQARGKQPIETTTDLAALLFGVLGRGRREKKIHPATLVFQGLRIAVNDELGSLREGLGKAIHALRKGGRLAVLSFHSLEDRIVKNLFREAAQRKEVILLTKKPLKASVEEVRINPRSRSACLRVIEKS